METNPPILPTSLDVAEADSDLPATRLVLF